MYTVLWKETDEKGKQKGRWERCEDRCEVAALLIRKRMQDDEDIIIFGPDAEDCCILIEDIFAAM